MLVSLGQYSAKPTILFEIKELSEITISSSSLYLVKYLSDSSIKWKCFSPIFSISTNLDVDLNIGDSWYETK